MAIHYPIEQYEMRKKLSIQVADAVMNHMWIRFSGKPEQTCDGKIEAFLCSESNYKKMFRTEKYMIDDGKYPKNFTRTSWLDHDYSNDMNEAMKVVAEMRKKGFRFSMLDYNGKVDIEFKYNGNSRTKRADFGEEELAICKLAIVAMELLPKISVDETK